MYRRLMSRHASASLYKRTARRTNVMNISRAVPRGGFRL